MWARVIFVFIIIVLQCQGKRRQLPCPGTDNYAKDVCLEGRDCLREMPDFKWKIKPESGFVTAVFKSLCTGRYTFSLETLDNPEETKCNGSEFGIATLSKPPGNDSEWFSHSTREVLIIDENERSIYMKGNYASCKEKVYIHFNMVYSSCYRLKVWKDNNSNSTLVSKPRYISTNLTKNEILDKYQDPILNSYYDAAEDYFEHRVIGLELTYAHEIHLNVLICDVNQDCDDCDILHTWDMTLNGDEDFVCKSGEIIGPSCFAADRNEIQCHTKNVDNKSQCLTIGIRNHPCTQKSGIWEEHKCTGDEICSKIAVVEKITKPELSMETDNKDYLVLLLLIVGLVAVCICVLFFTLGKTIRRWWIDDQSEPEEKYKPAIAPDILLLYSRDCEKFMKLMTTFRSLLRKALNCKVHDCYDPHLAERLSLGSVEWLDNHIDNKNVKVVVVESDCAMLHYRYLNNACKIEYQDPSCLDGLFLHALQRLKSDSRKNRYDTVFVVQIDGFSSADHILTSLTSQARYTLPLYLPVLFNVLYREPDVDCTEEKEAFKRDIADLQEYKEKNKDYLNSLLVEVKDRQAYETRLNILK
ncbi:uncharacterized protein [Periplaneta americana]|uniref:uncharacterized protein isoform X1 n=1 Tax=Periplaneta americana TaxID=6978 RepID=UPI0037E88556